MESYSLKPVSRREVQQPARGMILEHLYRIGKSLRAIRRSDDALVFTAFSCAADQYSNAEDDQAADHDLKSGA